MAWIELHDTLPDHYKTEELATKLGVTVVETVGFLACLWLKVIRFRPGGMLTSVSQWTIAKWAQWPGKPEAFVDAMVDVGFLKRAGGRARTLRVHDWESYTKSYRKAEADRDRKRRKRGGGKSEDSPGTGAVDRPTGPDRTRPDPPDPPQGDQFHGIVSALGFFKSPGWKAKRDAVAELVRLGISTDSIISKAKTMEAQSMDFWEFVKWCRGQKAGAARGIDDLRLS